MVDHFSRAGTHAVIDFWERRLLTPSIRKLLKRSGGALFEDSIEIESDALPWTPELPAEFERRRGYPLTDVLPVVVLADEDPVFAFDPVLTRHARKDYWDTVSELFNEHHFTALRDWAHSLGLRLRAQPYGLQTDAIEAAAILDVPEGESLGFKNLDDYRCLAGGRDMAGGAVLSCEAGGVPGRGLHDDVAQAAADDGRRVRGGAQPDGAARLLVRERAGRAVAGVRGVHAVRGVRWGTRSRGARASPPGTTSPTFPDISREST
ncbi:hypothetical protein GCM10020001_076450 [Nonomuraea salmonea]